MAFNLFPGGGNRLDLPPALSQRTLVEQLRFLHASWARMPLPMILLMAGIAGIVWPYVLASKFLAWSFGALGVLAIRGLVIRSLVRTGELERNPQRSAAWLWALTFLSGCSSGSAAYVFLPTLPGVEQGFLTMILCGWGAAAVSNNGAHPPIHRAFALGFYPPLIGFWALHGTRGGQIAAILLLALAILMTLSAGQFGALTVRSIAMRFENEALVAQLTDANAVADRERRSAVDANRGKARFLAAASHDLRQPLTALTLLAPKLIRPGDDPERVENAELIGRAVASLASLFEELLDLSRLDAGVISVRTVAFDVDCLVAKIGEEYRPRAAAKGLALRVDLRAGRAINSDPIHLERIVRNLVENALRYTETGFMAIETRIDPSAGAGDVLTIAISDSGAGIAADDVEKIFKEFYRGDANDAHRGGVGLGLAIVRRLIELLKLRIEVRSALAQGSRFIVTVPADRVLPLAQVRPPPVIPVAAEHRFEGLPVLVIDDDPNVLQAMVQTLQLWGCEVASARSLEQAMVRLDDGELQPRMLIVDYRLGGGPSGVVVVERLRDRIGPVPAVLVTADTSPSLLLELEQSGLTVLHKPVSPESLARTIHAELADR